MNPSQTLMNLQYLCYIFCNTLAHCMVQRVTQEIDVKNGVHVHVCRWVVCDKEGKES